MSSARQPQRHDGSVSSDRYRSAARGTALASLARAPRRDVRPHDAGGELAALAGRLAGGGVPDSRRAGRRRADGRAVRDGAARARGGAARARRDGRHGRVRRDRGGGAAAPRAARARAQPLPPRPHRQPRRRARAHAAGAARQWPARLDRGAGGPVGAGVAGPAGEPHREDRERAGALRQPHLPRPLLQRPLLQEARGALGRVPAEPQGALPRAEPDQDVARAGRGRAVADAAGRREQPAQGHRAGAGPPRRPPAPLPRCAAQPLLHTTPSEICATRTHNDVGRALQGRTGSRRWSTWARCSR